MRDCVTRPLASAEIVRRASVALALLALSSALIVPACSSADEENESDRCVTADLDCTPIVSPPTFDALYANIFKSSCATGTGSCHGPAKSNGLDMQTIDSAYAGLSQRVSPDSVGCSLLEKRVESGSSDFRMPPGPTPLSEPQRCAIRQWIAAGAQR